LVREMEAPMRAEVDRLRSTPVHDAEGDPIQMADTLGFGLETNPDARDATFVGTLVDVTRSEEV
jgi:hypothetical protein